MGLFLEKLGHKKINAKDRKETYIMLLDDLLESRVVQLREFGQVVNIGYDVTQHLLEQQKILIGRRPSTRSGARPPVPRLILIAFDELNDMLHFGLAGLNTLHNLLTLDLLEVEDLVEFAFQQGDEIRFVFFRPCFAVWLGVFGGWFRDVVGLEGFFQVIVGDIVPVVLADDGRSEMFPEPVREERRDGKKKGKARIDRLAYLMVVELGQK